MRRCIWVCVAVAAMALAGCHKKAGDAADTSQRMAPAPLAPGSTGDAMSQVATKFQIPIYSGAIPDPSHFSNTSANNRFFLAYTTPDAPDRVVAFYKGNLGLASSIQGAVTVMTGTTPTGADVTINVGLKMDGTGTSFSITIFAPETEQPDMAPVATTTPTGTQPMSVASAQVPAPVPAQTPAPDYSQPVQDSATYDISTSNSDDNSDTGDGGDQSTTGETNSGDQGGQTTDGQTQDNGNPPGGG